MSCSDLTRTRGYQISGFNFGRQASCHVFCLLLSPAQQPQSQVYINPLVLLSFLAELQDNTHKPNEQGTSNSKALLPLGTKPRGHAPCRPSQTTRFRALYFRCRKQVNALKKELQLNQEVLDLKVGTRSS